MTATDPLREATRAYVLAAIALLRRHCAPSPAEDDSAWEWVRASPEWFRLQPQKRYWWHDCLYRHRDAVHALPEYAVLTELLEADSQIGPLLGQSVGAAGNSRLVERHHVTDHLIWALARRAGAGEFDIAAFDDEYDGWDRELRTDRVQQVWIAPLMGFSTLLSPIRLPLGAEIDQLTDDEISLLLSVGLRLSLAGHGSTTQLTPVTIVHGLRIVRDHQRLVGENQVNLEDLSATWTEVNDLAEDVLIALRIFKGERVGSSGFLMHRPDWPVRGSMQIGHLRDFPPPAWPQGFNYQLSDEESASFAAFFASCSRAKTIHSVGLAMRRFAYASDRSRAEDRIIDLMIAAEALLLAEAGGELSYRLAVRGACFLNPDLGPRLDILHFLHRAYGVRSTIAHGSQPKPKDLRGLDGSVCATIQEFAAELERVMRVAVRKAVDHVASSGGFLTGDEWNVLILDGEDARR